MTDRVHASMDRSKEATGDAVLDRALAETEIEQLPAGDHAVLSLREGGDVSICSRFRFAPHWGAK